MEQRSFKVDWWVGQMLPAVMSSHKRVPGVHLKKQKKETFTLQPHTMWTWSNKASANTRLLNELLSSGRIINHWSLITGSHYWSRKINCSKFQNQISACFVHSRSIDDSLQQLQLWNWDLFSFLPGRCHLNSRQMESEICFNFLNCSKRTIKIPSVVFGITVQTYIHDWL